MNAFDVCGPLPQGTTVLEASAGTGKTYTIAALAARYVAEGVAELSQLMLVTFGRMATDELRLRVRERLTTLAERLGQAVTDPDGGVNPADPLEQLLICGPPGGPEVAAEERRARLERVTRALADFDAATIATTHEFCLRMLDGLGVLGDREPHAVFVEHLGELTREVTTDLYLQRYAGTGLPPASLAELTELATAVVNAPHAQIVPRPEEAEDLTAAAERVRFAVAVRAEVERRKRRGRLFTYDDMLTRLRDSLTDPATGEIAADRLRRRYRVVLVDEFQDTDPIQWEIIRRAFHGSTTLVLIGDPKQAIYAFRGADVFSYLDAVGHADQVRTLGTNWRSDQGLVSALDRLWGGSALGDPRILVRPVTAHHLGRRLLRPSGSEPDRPVSVAPLRLRYLPHEPDADGVSSVASLRPRIATDLVADITAVLASRVELEVAGGRRAIRPADIAVLVRRNERGEAIRDALVAAGVPAVIHGAGSVFSSPVAQDWLTLLAALDQPRPTAIRQAALTCFLGRTVEDLVVLSDDDLVDLAQRLRFWGQLLASRGVAALMEAATAAERVPERLLAEVGGARRLTDLRHLGQVLHAAMGSSQLGVAALAEWLRERMSEAQHALAGDGMRRLETDAAAVTILTVHRSKGLEFPLVYLPELWDRHVDGRDEGRILNLHQPTGPGASNTAVLDVGGRISERRSERFAAYRAEEAGEDLRLAYVALTRAQCQVVVWWAPSHNTASSALQRLLARSEDAVEPPESSPLSGDPTFARALGSAVALEPVEPRPVQPWQPAPDLEPRLSVRRFDRPLDLDWRRTSYSALTAAAHGSSLSEPGVGSEPEVDKELDEVVDLAGAPGSTPEATAPPGLDAVSPMAGLPTGAEFGTVVHAVLEAVDPGQPDLAGQLRHAAGAVLARMPATGLAADELAAALLPAFDTPLGPLAGDLRLRDIARRDRLAELAFELPLAGGDRPTASITLGQLGPLLARHLGPADPLHRYPELLGQPALADQPLRGFLTGSIDAVLRVAAGEQPAYLVVDYKTNWLGGFDEEPLLLAAYTPARMAAAMMAAHYPLQALLYSVAVHRLLRWRQSGYDPAVHLGGVLYLFVRGMAGADTPRVAGVPCGVFSWRPSPELVVELSDLLDGRAP